MILIITNKEDTHPTPVIRQLNERNIPVFRLNTEALLTDYQFCWQSDTDSMDFHIKNIQTGLEVSGSDIIAVWERRPEKPAELSVQNEPEINRHNLAEALGFLQFLRYYIKDLFSIGSIANDKIASSKMLQLKIARELGFRTPDSCFSNQKDDILKFASRYENIVLKSIVNDCIWNEEKGQEYVFYTRKIASDSLADVPEESFSQTVSFVQNYIEKLFELRITVVMDRFFACKIDSQILDDDKGKFDWRQGYDYGLKYEIYDLPPTVADFCLRYLERMNLHFGCFDMIVTPENEYVFLECNPNGQWLWIEEETGLNISGAITDVLSLADNLILQK